MGVRADELTHQAEGNSTSTTAIVATKTTVRWLPSCQLLASRVCAPTLLAVGVAAAEATHAAAAATGSEVKARQAALLALHEATSKPGRQLLAASLAALRCAAANPANASAVADCGRAAIAASPAAASALVGAVGPSPCASLASDPTACAAAAGCRLVPHGDHSDCEPAPSATAVYLTAAVAANSTTGAATTGTAASEPTALAAAVQRLADSCAALLPPAGEEEESTPADSAAAASLACGRAELLGAVVEAEALEALEVVAEGEHHEEGHDEGEEEGHEEGHSHGAAHDAHGAGAHREVVVGDGDNAQNLRIASVFIVLTAAVLGCTLPWVMRGWAERRPLLGAALRCMSAGVILCLALVHVATHAIEEMNGLVGGGGEEGGEGGHDGHGHRRMAISLLDLEHVAVAGGGSSGRHLLQDAAAAPAAPAATAGPLQQQLPYAGDLAGLLGLVDLGGLAKAAAGGGGHQLHEEDELVVEAGNSAHKHPFPIGMCCVMFGFLLMAGAEMVVHAVIERRAEKAAAAAADSMYAADKSRHAAMGGSGGGGDDMAVGDRLGTSKGALPDVEAAAPHQALPQTAQQPSPKGASAIDDSAAYPTDANMRLEVVAVSTSARLAGLAALFELGCVFHSFIIGLSLGVLTQRSEVAAILVALCIHQFAEGISLVSILMAAGLAGWRLAGMGLGYSLMAPAGIAVGIGISDSYDADSVTARAVQGTINGVSGGVLLYLAAVMITTELSANATTASGMAAAAAGGGGCCGAPPPRRWRGWERVLLFAIVVVSAAAFAVLAEWA
ncbi:hypothetical protein HYH02_015059 [Chlamydomonas schloesseri]|uniref:Uncharacterized protein n=1 Tax=Chlamydomonas schloesseri TaxID=2026947 RepID=A0A835SQT6_9CHLO|nr:hypothetical protein HYH02_015059 [Chlamydomonas schloesseri]|eukprot:KAG2425115.1 hypothetical protein HYH02_015059 [Chlamydomonas schloesseri]